MTDTGRPSDWRATAERIRAKGAQAPARITPACEAVLGYIGEGETLGLRNLGNRCAKDPQEILAAVFEAWELGLLTVFVQKVKKP